MYLSNIYYESKMLGAFAHGPVQAIWIFKFRGLLWCHHQYNCHVFHVEDIWHFDLSSSSSSSPPLLGLELTIQNILLFCFGVPAHNDFLKKGCHSEPEKKSAFEGITVVGPLWINIKYICCGSIVVSVSASGAGEQGLIPGGDDFFHLVF